MISLGWNFVAKKHLKIPPSSLNEHLRKKRFEFQNLFLEKKKLVLNHCIHHCLYFLKKIWKKLS
jgi:hypothetical protein